MKDQSKTNKKKTKTKDQPKTNKKPKTKDQPKPPQNLQSLLILSHVCIFHTWVNGVHKLWGSQFFSVLLCPLLKIQLCQSLSGALKLYILLHVRWMLLNIVSLWLRNFWTSGVLLYYFLLQSWQNLVSVLLPSVTNLGQPETQGHRDFLNVAALCQKWPYFSVPYTPKTPVSPRHWSIECSLTQAFRQHRHFLVISRAL